MIARPGPGRLWPRAPHADLANWNKWASHVVEPTPRFPKNVFFKTSDLRNEISAAVWPGTVPEIEVSLEVFTRVLLTSVDIFSEHIADREEPNFLLGDRFYRIQQIDPELYQLRLKEFNAWTETIDELMREATRAANWLAVTVRRHLNPMFFVLEGRFFITDGTGDSGSTVYEYTEAELQSLPSTLTQRLQSSVADYKSIEERWKRQRTNKGSARGKRG